MFEVALLCYRPREAGKSCELYLKFHFVRKLKQSASALGDVN
jgi:hypothetical protein